MDYYQEDRYYYRCDNGTLIGYYCGRTGGLFRVPDFNNDIFAFDSKGLSLSFVPRKHGWKVSVCPYRGEGHKGGQSCLSVRSYLVLLVHTHTHTCTRVHTERPTVRPPSLVMSPF